MTATPNASRALIRRRAGSGEPLVLLHGLGLAWHSWLPLLPVLEREHEVLALDLPGFGGAPRLPRGVAPTVGALAGAVEDALVDAGVHEAHFVGNSLGGWVALELARRGRAASVAAIAPSGLETPAERVVVAGANEWLRAQARVLSPLADAAMRLPPARTAALALLHSRPWRLDRAQAVREIRAIGRASAFHDTLRATTLTSVARGLDEIDCPSRVLFGTADLLLGALTAPRFAYAIPRAKLRALPGLGHVPMSDDPAMVADEILVGTAAA